LPDDSDVDKLNAELESRLDELFREDPLPAAPAAESAAPDPAAAEPHPLAELKKQVLSLDWEITAEALDALMDQIRLLKEVYRGDKTIAMFLKIFGFLGHYIKTSRNRVHQNTFAVLSSTFNALEDVLTSPGMSADEKRERLKEQMAQYQQLRQKVMKRRASEAGAPAVKPAGESKQPPPKAGSWVTAEDLDRAVRDLKGYIRSQLEALREELR
jgi:hypothetical protein